MKHLLSIALLCAAGAAAAGLPAPFQKAAPVNEAVRQLPGGGVAVEEPPGPKSAHRPVTKPSFWAPGVFMPSYVMFSKQGPKECAWPWLDAGCRDYVPKQDRRERAWVIKSGGRWLKCPRNDTLEKCVGYDELPSMAVQD
jgi:hypothetical protein